jgi:hypothetical protein
MANERVLTPQRQRPHVHVIGKEEQKVRRK